MSQKILILLSMIGILLLIFIVQNNQKIDSGKISSIEYSSKKITLQLKDKEEKLIIFDNQILDLKKGDVIEFTGTKEKYRQEEQIIVDKLWKIK